MSFVQLVAFHADDVTTLIESEAEWLAATAGRRTIQHSALYRDVHDPSHYVAYNAFPDRATAALQLGPSRDRCAGPTPRRDRRLRRRSPTSSSSGTRGTRPTRSRRRSGRSSRPAASGQTDVVSPDVTLTTLFPHSVGELAGRDALVHGLVEEAPARSFDRYAHQPTRDGFLVDYAYRTVASDTQPSFLSVGLIAATVADGRVTQATITCAGAWDAEHEAEIYGRTRGGGVVTTVTAPVRRPTPEAVPAMGADEAAGALAERMFGGVIATMEMLTVHLGWRFGFYEQLRTPHTDGRARGGDGDPAALRAGVVRAAGDRGVPRRGRPGRGSGRAPVRPAARPRGRPPRPGPSRLRRVGRRPRRRRRRSFGALLDAYRDGTGLSFGGYGDEVRIGQGLFNRAGFLGQLAETWVPGMPGVAELLGRPGAVALDLGCGVGWSTIALARAFPDLTAVGIDSDEASIMDARRNAVGLGPGRAGPLRGGPVRRSRCARDRPTSCSSSRRCTTWRIRSRRWRPRERPCGPAVASSSSTRTSSTPSPRTGRRWSDCMFASSVLHCLPVGLSEPDSAGTGAMMRPDVLRGYAAAAGFTSVDEADVTDGAFRCWVLTP